MNCALLLAGVIWMGSAGFVWGESIRKPIVIEETTEPLEDRLNRKITLDVREMSVIDVVKFLSLKGDFNMVSSNTVQGRVTLFLKNVSIKDALDIILISNSLA